MSEPLAFKNGRFLPRSALALDVHDVGFVAGASITDYTRTYGGKLFAWPRHLVRFRADCAACDVPLKLSDTELTLAAQELIAANYTGVELSLILCATPGTLGYMGAADERGSRGTVLMHTFPVPWDRYARFFTHGVELAVVGHYPIYDGGFTQLLSSKHRSRMQWHLARQHPLAKKHPEALPAFSTAGGTLDTAVGSVIAVRGAELFFGTPGTALHSISADIIRDAAAGLGYTVMSDAPPTPTELLLVGSAFGVAGIRTVITAETAAEYAWPGPAVAAFAPLFA